MRRGAAYSEQQLREWLNELRRFPGKDHDRATDMLDLLDDAVTVSADRAEMGDCAYELLVKYGLCVGDEPLPFLERLLAIERGVRGLCVQAGLLKKGDYETDMTPLLCMFLPI